MALILFGAWLFRAGLITKLGEHRYALLIGALLLIGLGLLLTAQSEGHLSLIAAGALVRSAVVAVAPLLIAFAFAALVLAASSSGKVRAILQWTVPVGRMAFTNYILQSVVLGLAFYGYGLRLMGELGAAAGFGIAIAIYTLQAWLSARWLRTHRFGPLEWLWRSAMYGKRQVWRFPSTSPSSQSAVQV